MLLRDNELARRQENRLELRAEPLRVRWSFNELTAQDGHALRVVFTCSVRALSDSIERRMFEEVLLGPRYSLTDDDLAMHFEPPLNTAAVRAAEKHTAAEWVTNDFHADMIEALRLAAAPVAFGCGVELLPPFQVDITSPGYQRQRMRAMQQDLAERETAGQVQHVQRAAELLKSFQSIRDSAPDLSPGRVLQQISPSDQGAVLQTLLLASAKQRQADGLWAVAGPYLVRIEMQGGAPRPQLIPLPPALGPLRSVSVADVEGGRRLLLGARTGFILVDPQNTAEPELFQDTGFDSPLGFNRVQYWAARRGFVASHGDGGIVFWTAGDSAKPQAAVRPAQFLRQTEMIASESGSTHTAGPRNVQILDDSTLVFSAGNQLFTSDLNRAQPLASESNSEIVAILPDDGRMIIVHEDGTLCAIDRNTRQVDCISRRGTRIRSAGTLPWLGATRLLLAGDQGSVQCVGLEDGLVTEYTSPHRGMRAVVGSTDAVAGVSGDRQRIILWQSWDGRQPLSEVYLTGLTRHRVADVGFG